MIRFPYLPVRESARGETEGRKTRPVAVGVRIARPEAKMCWCCFPITSQPPSPGRFAAEIPEMEKRRAGLDVALQLWIILDEYNQDTIGRSFYLEPEPPLGRWSWLKLPAPVGWTVAIAAGRLPPGQCCWAATWSSVAPLPK